LTLAPVVRDDGPLDVWTDPSSLETEALPTQESADDSIATLPRLGTTSIRDLDLPFSNESA
jgi:hypothetical protein